MLTVDYIKAHKDYIVERLKVRNLEANGIIEQVLNLDEERKQTQTELDRTLAESKQISREIGRLFKEGKQQEAEKAKAKTGELKQRSKDLNERLSSIHDELNGLLPEIPNVPHADVVQGKGEEDNVEIRQGGTVPEFDFTPVSHWELAEKYQLIRFELGNKVTGSGFPFYMGKGAKLQRALIQFFLDEGEKAGYHEVLPPFFVNRDSAFATGQLPDKEGQMYRIESDGFFPVPTAEVPVTNIYRDVILEAGDFPVKHMAYSPCFRREAGSYGKNVRGLNRVHQFDKVEIVQLSHPDNSWHELKAMMNYVESLIQKLQLPYRVMRLCGGDMGFAASMTYDFEVYSAAQEKWLEVSSVSNFTDYQANRLKLRFREKGQKGTRLAHTLNGSALALPRILAAVLENYQQEDSVAVPEVLQPYTHFSKID